MGWKIIVLEGKSFTCMKGDNTSTSLIFQKKLICLFIAEDIKTDIGDKN